MLQILGGERPDGQEAELWMSQCRSSTANITNRVLTPTQTVLILMLPLIQTFTYPDLLPVIALKRQSRHLPSRACVERCD